MRGWGYHMSGQRLLAVLCRIEQVTGLLHTFPPTDGWSDLDLVLHNEAIVALCEKQMLQSSTSFHS